MRTGTRLTSEELCAKIDELRAEYERRLLALEAALPDVRIDTNGIAPSGGESNILRAVVKAQAREAAIQERKARELDELDAWFYRECDRLEGRE